MQSSDTPAPVGERPGALAPAAAAGDAAKARQNNGVEGDNKDHIIDAALCDRFVLSAEEVNLFFFREALILQRGSS